MPLGNSELAGIAYYSGNPSSAPVVGFDVAKGTLVIDQTNGELYQKNAAQGTNTGGYVTIGSQMEKVTTLLSKTSVTLEDIVGLSGFALEAATTYKISGSLPVTNTSTGGALVSLNFLSTTAVSSYAIGTASGAAVHQGNAGSGTNLTVIDKGTQLLFVAFEGIITTTLATTMKVQAAQNNALGTTTFPLGGTVTVTKVL